MKKIILILIAFIIIQNVFAQEINDYDNLQVQTKISSSLALTKSSSNYEIDYIFANLTLFPRNNAFQASENSFNSDPSAKITENKNAILYRWDNPSQDELKFSVDSMINSKTNFKEITTKVKFPIEDNNQDTYTKATETVTSNDLEIKKLASSLAQGEDDLYNVVWKLALWTHGNINYSLETLTAEASQNASWVLDNKKGVCDELTSLFIAMLRSLNIPARFATGQSYSNVIDGFGNHAWAEVYFPEYGWVAFDPTYGQYGYVDASHIIMGEELDVKESSVNYGWRSYDVDVNANSLDANSEVISKGGLFKKNIKINLNLLENDVGPGSYVPVQVTLTNLNNFYLPYTFYITKAPNLIQNNVKDILLKPGETKSVFFLVNGDNNLDPGFIYTAKVEIKDIFDNVATQDLKYANTYSTYSLQDAQEKIDALKEEEVKVFSNRVKLECNKDKDFYYNYDKININCTLTNLGNTNLNDLSVCLKESCKSFDLIIAEEKEFNFSLNANENLREIIVKAENDDISQSEFVKLNVLKLPNIRVSEVKYPSQVKYNGKYNIEFILTSDSEADYVVIKLADKEIKSLESFNGKQRFNLDFKGKQFYDKAAKISIEYKDKNNVNYNIEEPLIIEVTSIPIYTKFWFWLIIILLIISISMILRSKQRP